MEEVDLVQQGMVVAPGGPGGGGGGASGGTHPTAGTANTGGGGGAGGGSYPGATVKKEIWWFRYSSNKV